MSSCRLAVAHVGPDPAGGGGIPAFIRGVQRSPLADRHALHLIASYPEAQKEGRRGLAFARACAKLAAFCLRRGPRLVHVHVTVRGSMHRKAVIVAIAKWLRRRVVLHVHAGAGDLGAFHARLGRTRKAAFARTFTSADAVLAVSGATAEQVRRLFGVEAEVVPNAAPVVPPDVPAHGAGRSETLYLGGFANPVKGGALLLEAAPLLLAAVPRARLVLAGPGEPPRTVAALAPATRWLGWLDDEAKQRALRDADVFVLPSTSEGLPLALLEAMAYGKAIVATAVGGVPDAAEDGREAVVVAPGDPAALAGAIAGLLDEPDRREALGRAACARAAAMGPDALAERLGAIYAEVMR